MLNLREAYDSNGETTLETRSHEMHFYRSALRRKTHTTFDTAWALDSSKVCTALVSLRVGTERAHPGLPNGSQWWEHPVVFLPGQSWRRISTPSAPWRPDSDSEGGRDEAGARIRDF